MEEVMTYGTVVKILSCPEFLKETIGMHGIITASDVDSFEVVFDHEIHNSRFWYYSESQLEAIEWK